MTTLHDLLERVERAEGADREIDADIYIAILEPGWVKAKRDPGAVAASERYFWPEGRLRYQSPNGKFAPRYTASIDAATALFARLLLGWRWTLIYMRDGSYFGDVSSAGYSNGENDVQQAEGTGKSAPLALLAAILRAKIGESAHAP